MKIAVAALWGALAVYWRIAAAGVKHGSRRPRTIPGLMALAAVILLRVSRGSGPTVHSQALQAIGLALSPGARRPPVERAGLGAPADSHNPKSSAERWRS